MSEDRRNDQQGYAFRGIDEIYNALCGYVADAKLMLLPRVASRDVTERATRNGGVATYVVLAVDFDLVSAVDGSIHTIRTMGEAMDSADKATNKSMSAAMKYACLMVFMIPTKGDNDADAWHPQKASPRNHSGRGNDRAPVPAKSEPRAMGGGEDPWLEWALAHTIQMKQAQSAGELKAAFSTAWREADHRNAPAHIKQSLEKCKNDLKAAFPEAS
jgi:hypothetical protein